MTNVTSVSPSTSHKDSLSQQWIVLTKPNNILMPTLPAQSKQSLKGDTSTVSASFKLLVTSVLRDRSVGKWLSAEPIYNLIEVQVHARAPFPPFLPLTSGSMPGIRWKSRFYLQVRGESKVQKNLIATLMDIYTALGIKLRIESGRICRNMVSLPTRCTHKSKLAFHVWGKN